MAINETWRQVYKPDGSTTMVLIESVEVPDPVEVEDIYQKVARLEKEIEQLKANT